jgi:hypothetical protein
METTATRFDRRASTYETSDLQVLNFAGGVAASQKGWRSQWVVASLPH